MKKIASIINKKVMMGGGLLAAVVLCSATTAVVVATGTASDYVDSSGQIRSCRDNSSGNVRILDNDTENCNSGETQVSWSQQGGSAVLHDANGQIVGNMIDSRDGYGSPLVVYNSVLKRIVTIGYNNDTGTYAVVSAGNGIFFESGDCTGQPYTYDEPRLGLKTELLRTGPSSYGIVQNNTSAETLTMHGYYHYDAENDSFDCQDDGNHTAYFYKVDSVSLPFETPLAGPFKF